MTITATNKRRTYGFIIRQEKWAGCDSVACRIVVREGKSRSPINPRGDGEHTIWDAPKRQHGLVLEGLEIRAYLASDGKFVCTMGPHYDTQRFVDLEKAEKMRKTLRHIQRRIERDRATTGSQMVDALARAIGAKFVAFCTNDRGGWSYSNSDWSFQHVKYAAQSFQAVVDGFEERRVKEVA